MKSVQSLVLSSVRLSYASLTACFASSPTARLSMVGKIHLSHSGGTPYSFLQGCLLQKTKESMRNTPSLQLTEDFTTISLKLGFGMCTLLGK